MNYYRVVYQPTGRRDKEWTVWEAESSAQLAKDFNAGIVIKIEEISKEEFDANFEDF